ncbi:2-C-methyl-D-erythritol 4-phosphate cytidylyltransferase [Clostridium sp. D2Q-11]|uniref:2-C-methyl-D-erythritol 4-phosphate cytidylyltransferase n=1 Tax=Anaeromonas frigoriresistens TaxID=2683708 RepID=A0A942Z7D2_9FIRM|nr:2-C-methyl-D-erythritol 4-phosphate cytidylyltransferase [Anaeromonas frigoriresistens]MBS4536855.1 2-C-methyl-D-erythritol 4-phosphate cytidylyltransferase [Anaeromonas frigoriresistens]
MSYNTKKVSIVIPAAGMGKRMNKDINKQYIELKGKAILAWTIERFDNNKYVDEIIIVAKEDEIDFCKENIIKKYKFKKVKDVVAGGNERRDSVFNGLKKVSENTGIVLIHDGARPFVTDEIINDAIKEALQNNAIVVGVPVKDTIKKVKEDNTIVSTPNRKGLWAVQTPQGFSYELILNCYNRGIEEDIEVTDDSMLVEYYGHSVKMIIGSYKNIKITTPEDVIIGEAFIK